METKSAETGDRRPGYGPLPTPPARSGRGHPSSARARILNLLVDQPEPCTVKALTALTRQHPNTVREHLDGLVDDRYAVRTRSPAHGRGRPAWLYSAATEDGSEQGFQEYAGLVATLAAQIARSSRKPRADSIEAGRLWGRQLIWRSPDGQDARTGFPTARMSAIAARREVVALLGRLGFAPRPDSRFGVVKLCRCPLLEAAYQHPEVVCAVHLGVVRGALEELGAGADQTERTALQPFSEPGACRLDLLPRPATRTRTAAPEMSQ